jgi:redox-sensitive bicupin YhaK (pirin superfamily)
LTIEAREQSRLMLLGGTPFGEEIVMWWNFIGRTHEDIVEYREDWEALLTSGTSERFRLPEADAMGALHAPTMPGVRLRSRH